MAQNVSVKSVTKEHDEEVFREVMENPDASPVAVSLGVITRMLRRERELCRADDYMDALVMEVGSDVG